MQQHPRITYAPHSDATQESERNALASAYAFILRCHEEQEAAGQSGQDSARGEPEEQDEVIQRSHRFRPLRDEDTEEKEGGTAAAPSDAKEIRNDRATQKYTG